MVQNLYEKRSAIIEKAGEEVRLSDDQKKAMEETLLKRQEWRKKKEKMR